MRSVGDWKQRDLGGQNGPYSLQKEAGSMEAVLVDKLVGPVSRFPVGTVIVISIESGEYLATESREAALVAFEQRFGWVVPAAIHVLVKK